MTHWLRRTLGLGIVFMLIGSVPGSAHATSSAPLLIPIRQGAYFTAAIGTTLYVANSIDGTISVVSMTTNRVTATFSGLPGLQAIAANPLTKRLYVATDQTVTPLDAATGHLAGPPIEVFVSIDAGLAVDPAANRIFVGDADGNTVTTIDGSIGFVYQEPLGVITAGNIMDGMMVDPASGEIYAAALGDNVVAVIDQGEAVVTALIPAGASPSQVALDPGLRCLYVTSEDTSTISVIDLARKHRLGGAIVVGKRPLGIAVDSRLHHVYVANYEGKSVTVLDGRSCKLLASLRLADSPAAIAIGAKPGTLYVTLPDAGKLAVLHDPMHD